MTPIQTDAVTCERFVEWAVLLKQYTATPVAVVACGHGDQVGTVHVLHTGSVSQADIARVLRYALRRIEGGPVGGEGGAS